jgi:molybdate transport system ATP-binding protein
MSVSLRLNIRRGTFHLDVDHAFSSGGVIGLTGPSGCGKTTLLRAIAGLDKHSGCQLNFGDQTWQNSTNFVAVEKRRIGYVSQRPTLFPHLSVASNINYGANRANKADAATMVKIVVAKLGLKAFLDKPPSALSRGEQQRVSLARALASKPQLLLLDEPFTGLDNRSKYQTISQLREIVSEMGIATLYVSHSLDEIAQAADELALMDSGKIIASGSVNSIYTRMDLPLAFQADAESVVTARIHQHCPEHHLTELEMAGSAVFVGELGKPVGGQVRLRIAARDVSLSLEKPRKTSILNILEASIADMKPSNDGQVTVALNVAGQTILAKVTSRSAAALNLVKGRHVFAQVKGIAVHA